MRKHIAEVPHKESVNFIFLCVYNFQCFLCALNLFIYFSAYTNKNKAKSTKKCPPFAAGEFHFLDIEKHAIDENREQIFLLAIRW